jgi:hypothetical protein
VCVVARCPGSLMHLYRTVSDDDVGGKHLLPDATFLRLSGTEGGVHIPSRPVQVRRAMSE